MDWNESVVLITGAATGIGESLANQLYSEGARLSLVDLNGEELETSFKHENNESDDILLTEADVTDEAGMADVVDQTVQEFDRVDVAVANAGLGYPTPGDQLEMDSVKRLLDVNINGVLNTIAPCIEEMKNQDGGQLTLISSSAAFRGIPGGAAYCASKAAVLRLGESIRFDLDKHDIDVTTIHPGWIETPMTDPFEESLRIGEISAREAAEHIQYAIETNKNRYIFPWQMALTIKFMQWMPESFVDFLLSMAPSPEESLRNEPRTEDQILK